MDISSGLDRFHSRLRSNRWFGYFAVFNRIVLAAGFLPSGFIKIMGERFTSLSVNHPMGHYLEALHHTGYYYTFIGVLQVTAAILLLIPRTALLGAIIYFPIILNICILSYAVRFEGSHITSPLMIMALLYLFCWDYHKLKFILPFKHSGLQNALPKKEEMSKRFPVKFFAGVFATVCLSVFLMLNAWEIQPRNHISDCRLQCAGSDKPQACYTFCSCIHEQGQPLDSCLDAYNKAP